jgi:hypothetical protein
LRRALLSVFAIPKPFIGRTGIIQMNALASWSLMSPDCEVILIGDEEGVEESARGYSATWIPDVARNSFGTPLLSDAFSRAESAARHDVMCYVNADILLPPGFPLTVTRVQMERFLLVGGRFNLDVEGPLDFTDPDWWERCARDPGLSAAWGLDYFAFPRGAMGQLPPFAVGRPGWDNWMISRARELRVPIVDATPSAIAIHQNHDYAHIADGSGDSYEGAEATENYGLLDRPTRRESYRDATWVIETTGLRKRSLLLERLPHAAEVFWATTVTRSARAVARRIRSSFGMRGNRGSA